MLHVHWPRPTHRPLSRAFRTQAAAFGILLVMGCAGSRRSVLQPAPAITSFKASSAPIRAGESVNLTGVFVHGQGVVTPGSIPVASGQPLKVTPTNTTTYTLTVSNPAGKATQTASIPVLPAGKPILSQFTAALAEIPLEAGMAVDKSGNVYLVHPRCRDVRKVSPAGVETVLAGDANAMGSADGPGESARFHSPRGLAVDAMGNVYVADAGNATIRKITPEGLVSTLAGMAGAPHETVDGTGVAARFINPWALAVDQSGNLYVSDANARAIRKVTATGVTTTLAKTSGSFERADGSLIDAAFGQPLGLAVDASGNVYVADRELCRIQKISPSGEASPLAGKSGRWGREDGPVETASFGNPCGVAVDHAGNVYVADTGNNIVRKITPEGMVSTIAGTAGMNETTLGILPGILDTPTEVALNDSTGDLFISQRNSILKISF